MSNQTIGYIKAFIQGYLSEAERTMNAEPTTSLKHEYRMGQVQAAKAILAQIEYWTQDELPSPERRRPPQRERH